MEGKSVEIIHSELSLKMEHNYTTGRGRAYITGAIPIIIIIIIK